MKTIISKLEDNIFSGILVKKGENRLTDKECDILFKNHHFCAATGSRYVFLRLSDVPKPKAEITTPDFDQMTYNELKAYAKKHNVKPASNKQADIIEALKSL